MEYQALLMEEEQKVELLKLRLKIGKERSLSQTKEIASLRYETPSPTEIPTSQLSL